MRASKTQEDWLACRASGHPLSTCTPTLARPHAKARGSLPEEGTVRRVLFHMCEVVVQERPLPETPRRRGAHGGNRPLDLILLPARQGDASTWGPAAARDR